MTRARPSTGAGPVAISVLVADGEPALRSGIVGALEERGLRVCAAVGDAGEALAAAERERPDVCLLSLDLAGNGLAAVAQIAARLPATTIVVLARSASAAEMLEALERGASGYLLKEIGADELARTLRAAHAGEPAIARSLVPHLIEHIRSGSQRRLALPSGPVSLTPREWDVAELVQEGLSTEAIGARLGLSTVTVRRHISSLTRKSGAKNRAGLIELLKLFARG